MAIRIQTISERGNMNFILNTVYEQAGWRRPNDLTLLTNSDIPQNIYVYNYDLQNLGFIR